LLIGRCLRVLGETTPILISWLKHWNRKKIFLKWLLLNPKQYKYPISHSLNRHIAFSGCNSNRHKEGGHSRRLNVPVGRTGSTWALRWRGLGFRSNQFRAILDLPK
jgi:hypothetical protein